MKIIQSNIDVFRNDLQACEFVSFDIFDTAVIRNICEPKDLFLIMEKILIDQHGDSRYRGFAQKRFTAELDIVTKTWADDRALEIDLDDIYHNLCHLHPEFETTLAEIKALELETEALVTVQNPEIYSIYQQARDLGKKIIFISDIYLPKTHIEKLLSQCQYDTYAKLFVSCEIGTNKASGKLFDYVISSLDIAPEKIVHLGDSFHSDVTQAAARGLKSHHVTKGVRLLSRDRYYHKDDASNLGASTFRALQKNYKLLKENASVFDVGYQVLGPIVCGFTNWLCQHAKSKKITDLYFIAREGWFLKRAYDLLADCNAVNAKSHYLLASRRSLIFPLISENVGEVFLSFAVSRRPASIRQYLDIIEVSANHNDIVAAGFEGENQIIDPYHLEEDANKLSTLMDNISSVVIEAATREKNCYLRYLNEVGMLASDAAGLVDSGWFGSGQARLDKLVHGENPNAMLYGFYFALHKKATDKFSEKSPGHGYLFNFDDFGGDIEEFLELARLIEVFLSAPSESFKKFEEVDGELVPRYVRENSNPHLDKTIEEIQRGAEAYIRDYANLPKALQANAPMPLMRHLLMDFIRNPSANEAKQVGAIPYESNVLAAEVSPKFADPERGTLDVILRPKQFSSEFTISNWRAAYYRNLDSVVAKAFIKLVSRYYREKNPHYLKLKRMIKKIIRKLKR